MNESELNQNIDKILSNFESLDTIQPSIEWNDSLQKKLYNFKKDGIAKNDPQKLIYTMASLVIINVLLLSFFLATNPRESNANDNKLKLISKELLINPSSASY